MDVKSLFAIVEKHRAFALQAREHLHQYPELSDAEFKTTEFIKNSLSEYGIKCSGIDGMTGVVAIIPGNSPGKTIALRADIDALPIQEHSKKPYKSKIPNVMHACGHDVHTAILLGTARVLQDVREQLQGNVKLFFQPAEETNGGAKRMVMAGCMKDPNVEEIYGLHVDAEIPCGTLRTKKGAFNASSDTYKVLIRGKKAHGASPHLGHDAIIAAASIVLELQTIISRRIPPQNSAVITIGTISGGSAENVVADEATLTIMLRTTNAVDRRTATGAIERIIQNVCKMHGVKVKMDVHRGYDSMYNDEFCVEEVRSVAERVLGEKAFSYVEYPFMGSEDFCYYCTDIPGAFYQLGSRNDALGITGMTHSAEYDADPETVINGIKMQAGIVLDRIGTSIQHK